MFSAVSEYSQSLYFTNRLTHRGENGGLLGGSQSDVNRWHFGVYSPKNRRGHHSGSVLGLALLGQEITSTQSKLDEVVEQMFPFNMKANN